MKKIIVGLLLIALLVIGYATVSASQTEDLHPAYRLMNDGDELGVVYWLDYGMLILTEEDTIYTCGCDEGCPIATWVPAEPTKTHTPDPKPRKTATPEPTKEVSYEKQMCLNDKNCKSCLAMSGDLTFCLATTLRDGYD